MKNFEEQLDHYLTAALDIAVHILNKKGILPPYSFLILNDHSLQTLVPKTNEFLYDDPELIDNFKEYGQQEMMLGKAAGYCVISSSALPGDSKTASAITVFFKFLEDPLPLKTRVYYFPYLVQNGQPTVLFDAAFSSEG